jgi:alpha-N-arabinofuranosidase
MPTFGAWEDTVLDLAWEVADYVSLHTYYDPDKHESVDAFLACSLDLDRMIDTVAATADSVAGRKGSRRKVPLSVDEWNVWHQTGNPGYQRRDVPFEHAPAITEDDYTVADALVVGCLLITLLRHADRVRMACLAQLVNVIPPIRTLDGGPAWRQTSYFPFLHASRHGRGTVLRVEPDAPAYDVPGEGSVSALEATAVHGDEGLTVFAVNRGAEPLALEARVRDLEELVRCEHVALFDDDLYATNTAERPDRVAPAAVPGSRVEAGVLRAELPARSWNVVRLSR